MDSSTCPPGRGERGARTVACPDRSSWEYQVGLPAVRLTGIFPENPGLARPALAISKERQQRRQRSASSSWTLSEKLAFRATRNRPRCSTHYTKNIRRYGCNRLGHSRYSIDRHT